MEWVRCGGMRLYMCLAILVSVTSSTRIAQEFLSRALLTFSLRTCPTQIASLRCTRSTAIMIHSASYKPPSRREPLCLERQSTRSSSDSMHNAVPNPMDVDCSVPGTLQHVVFECQDRRRCDLFISNTTFGPDPCPEVLKVLTLHYHCRPVELRSRVACEPGKMRLRCPRGSLIVPQHAEFGRSPTSGLHCATGHAGAGHGHPKHMQDCQSTRVLRIVTSQCLGRSMCPLYASSHIFGDPCPFGTWKRLFVIYYCVPVRVLDEAAINRDETSALTSHPTIAAPLTSVSFHFADTRLTPSEHRMNSTAHSTSKRQSTWGWGFNLPTDLSSTPYVSPSTIIPSTRLRWISPHPSWHGLMSEATQNPLQTRIGHSDLLVTSSLASFGTLAGNLEHALLSFMAGVCLGLLLSLAALLPTATPWQGGTKYKTATNGRRGLRDEMSDEDGDSDYSSSASSLLPRYPNSPCVALASELKECETRPPPKWSSSKGSSDETAF